MKRRILITVILLSLFGAVLAETNSATNDYSRLDKFAIDSAEMAVIPEGLTEREAEIYRDGYMNGYYDALHPAYIPGTYLLNTKTKKFHNTNCLTALTIESNNKDYSTLTLAELQNLGYKPCGQCHPEQQSTVQAP